MLIDELLEAIQVPESKYNDANRAYLSLCEWMTRPESTLSAAKPDMSLQGSFRLGTAIRPLTDEDDYDVDVVCELQLRKDRVAPSNLKSMVGAEVKSYGRRHNMKEPKDGRRCWTQDYADESQFHIDTLPAIPDAQRQRFLLENQGLDASWAEQAIAITDKTDANYFVINDRWPLSNPKGYAAWFESRMASLLAKRRSAIALAEAKSVEDIPTYRARVPLQSAIQILKFHRDVMFIDDCEDKPISIIITTLAAQSYQDETEVPSALHTILRDMDLHIEQRHGIDWVANPTNGLENFADKWVEYPQRRTNFYEWLEAARSDFRQLEGASTREEATQLIQESFGDETLARMAARRKGSALTRLFDQAKARLLRNAPHRAPPPWTPQAGGSVRIHQASKHESGFRPQPLSSDGPPIRKGADLRFYAKTDIPRPYEVYWQVVNTGQEAENARCLRGGFDTGSVHSGHLMRKESTKYSGVHSIECFIVKNGYLVARSGQFIVNIS